MRGHSVLFTTAVDIINTLTAGQTVGRLKNELKRYLKPVILAIDELGYLPIDKAGADLLFQVISQRYEQGSILLTTNQPYKHWPKIFNNDSTLTSAVLGVLHRVVASKILIRVIGEFWGALENWQIVARPVNVQRFKLLLRLGDRRRAFQGHPSVALDAGLVLNGDPGDESAVAMPQSYNGCLRPSKTFTYLCCE